MNKYIIGIDEGTTSTRAVLFDCDSKQIVNIKSKKFQQIFPHSAWVEHDADEIVNCVFETIEEVVKDSKISLSQIISISITNQRETVVAWDRDTLKPVCNAIVWQCRRTSDYCSTINDETKTMIRKKTGLLLDPYFSATKMKWILDNVPLAKELNDKNKLCFGTIDTYLMARLSKGEIFATDATNASRTMLMNISTCTWDDDLLNLFGIKKSSLGKIMECSDNFGYAYINNFAIQINGVIGDQQSSLFGQGCFDEGEGKNTFGTGCFILINTGNKLKIESNNLLSTVAWKLNGDTYYALEGSVFNAGCCIDWAKNNCNLFDDYAMINACLKEKKDNDGVYFVPALTGLGAPNWSPDSRGIITGLNRGTTNIDIFRAIVQSLAFSTNDILKESSKVSPLKELSCDGGVSRNDELLQFLSDITGLTIKTQKNIESTVLGSIFMAGLRCGVFENIKDIKKYIELNKVFYPDIDGDLKNRLLEGWDRAIRMCLVK